MIKKSKARRMELLKQLCELFGPSGNETEVKEFILSYVRKHSSSWKVAPEVLHGEEFQDCIMLAFGKPRTAIFAHMDTVGFTVRYQDQLVAIGGPGAKSGWGAREKGAAPPPAKHSNCSSNSRNNPSTKTAHEKRIRPRLCPRSSCACARVGAS